MEGWAAIENKVRLRFANKIRLHNGVYLDQNTYLHACPNGIDIGENTIVMTWFNFACLQFPKYASFRN